MKNKIKALCVLPLLKYILSICICLILLSCQTRGSKSTRATLTWNIYQNDYISIAYPKEYIVYGEFKYGTDNPPTPNYSVYNEIYVTPKDTTKSAPWLRIVLSRFKLQLPLYAFLQLSLYEKKMSGYDVYVDDIDSTSFSNLPALAATFYYDEGFGDTLIQRQYIVQLPNYELYYINILCYQEDDDNPKKMDIINKMLCTLRFKHQTEEDDLKDVPLPNQPWKNN